MPDPTPVSDPAGAAVRRLHRLQAAVYAQPDPAADPALRAELAAAWAAVRAAGAAGPAPPRPGAAEPGPGPPAGRFLGPETTGLRVEPTVHLNPVPTAIYPLLDPATDPLLTVAVTNVSLDAKSKRVCVRAWVEGLSAEAVRTVELKRGAKDPAVLRLLPLLLPERARRVTTARRATLHLRVDDLDGRPECHDTFPLVFLARTCGFNAVRDPATGEPKDLTAYYGAWVTPHAPGVQERVRRAAALHPAGRLAGYTAGGPGRVREQVAALYRAVQEAGLAYVNAVTDYGAPPDSVTQRARLPRETLARRSANCLDGTILFASLLEGASLSPALLLIPGHALVGWESDEAAGDWEFLETTMVGTADFDAARRSGTRQYQEACEFAPDGVRLHRVADLRGRGIWPMT
jgi:hypothetical protein